MVSSGRNAHGVSELLSLRSPEGLIPMLSVSFSTIHRSALSRSHAVSITHVVFAGAILFSGILSVVGIIMQSCRKLA